MADRGQSPDHLAFLKSLRQSRRFLDKPVPQAIVDDLLAAGRETAGGEAADWQFLVVDDLVTKKALAASGTFSEILASTAVTIVVLHEGAATPSKANMESRIADRIMREAGAHGLAGGIGWFGTEDAQEAARAILGVPARRQVCVAVGVGYVDEEAPGEASPLDRARSALDRLAGFPRDPKREDD